MQKPFSSAVAKMSLKTAINQVRERVGDPEKMQGVKLSKDDKVDTLVVAVVADLLLTVKTV